jgi:GNAT superfamily N-acetyltransferase
MQYACRRIAVIFSHFSIVILDDRDQIKRYGAARQHDINAQGEAERKPISMIIRRLTAFEREAVGKFYLSLSADDRRRRFCCALSDATISGYVDRMNFARDTILGAFDAAARIIGLAELVRGPDASEMAFSVRADKRGKKIGTTLLQELMLRARICGARKVFVMFSQENTPMRRMASRAGMTLSVVDGEAHAARELAAPSAQEMAHWFAGESAAHGEYFSALTPVRPGALACATAAPAPPSILASAP